MEEFSSEYATNSHKYDFGVVEKPMIEYNKLQHQNSIKTYSYISRKNLVREFIEIAQFHELYESLASDLFKTFRAHSVSFFANVTHNHH